MEGKRYSKWEELPGRSLEWGRPGAMETTEQGDRTARTAEPQQVPFRVNSHGWGVLPEDRTLAQRWGLCQKPFRSHRPSSRTHRVTLRNSTARTEPQFEGEGSS